MPRLKRKQLFVDPDVQGAFLWRVTIYFGSWLLAAGVTATTLGMTSFLAQNDYQMVGQYWFFMKLVLAASLLLLPIILYDIGVLTNRVVGPLKRLRNEMRRLGEGQRVELLEFREGDYWREFAAEFNAVAQRIADLEDELEAVRRLEFCLPAGDEECQLL
jgi:hypothetical protein